MTRSGFSLIEVILSTAIMLGSVVVLSELAGLGRRQSNRAETETIAQQKCENLLNEILLGERPLEPIEDEPLLPAVDLFAGELSFDVDQIESNANPFAPKPALVQTVQSEDGEMQSDWSYSIRITPHTQSNGLATLTVTVRQSDEQLPRRTRFQLVRWIKDPFAINADELAEPDFPSSGEFGL